VRLLLVRRGLLLLRGVLLVLVLVLLLLLLAVMLVLVLVLLRGVLLLLLLLLLLLHLQLHLRSGRLSRAAMPVLRAGLLGRARRRLLGRAAAH